MTEENKNPQGEQPRRAWTQPEVMKLEAGSAEDSSGVPAETNTIS